MQHADHQQVAKQSSLVTQRSSSWPYASSSRGWPRARGARDACSPPDLGSRPPSRTAATDGGWPACWHADRWALRNTLDRGSVERPACITRRNTCTCVSGASFSASVLSWKQSLHKTSHDRQKKRGGVRRGRRQKKIFYLKFSEEDPEEESSMFKPAELMHYQFGGGKGSPRALYPGRTGPPLATQRISGRIREPGVEEGEGVHKQVAGAVAWSMEPETPRGEPGGSFCSAQAL